MLVGMRDAPASPWRKSAGRPLVHPVHPVDYVCRHCQKPFQDCRHGGTIRIYCSRRCANLAAPSRSQLGSQGDRKFIDGRSGYIILTDENGRRWFEHRAVMEKKLRRKLLPWPLETVHHMNAIKTDNRPESLELWLGNHGSGQRAADLRFGERHDAPRGD